LKKTNVQSEDVNLRRTKITMNKWKEGQDKKVEMYVCRVLLFNLSINDTL